MTNVGTAVAWRSSGGGGLLLEAEPLELPLLGRRWLVLLCIDSYDSEQRRILQHFSRSTRFAFFSRPYFSKFCKFSTIVILFFDKV